MSRHLAWLTQALLLVSLISGILITFAYYPNSAYDSVQKLNYLIPFGELFRQVHYFSSEAFLVALLLHIIIELYRKQQRITERSWLYAVLGFALAALLMFTGFVLKGDQSANAAAQVAFSLLKETPGLEALLPLVQDRAVFVWKFFVWHILFLPLLLAFAVIRHSGKLGTRNDYFAVALGLTMLLTLMVAIPPDIAPEANIEHLTGPWFFWGTENLLQMGLSALLVNLILALPVIILTVTYRLKFHVAAIALLAVWTLGYLYASF